MTKKRNRETGSGLLILPLAALATALTACAAVPGESASAGDILAQEPPPTDEDLRELADRYRLDNPPQDVAFERYISLDEYADVLVPCLTEQGIPAQALPDGGVGFGDIPPEQAILQAEALYRCHVRFPTHPMFSEPLDDDQLRRLYGYLTGDLTRCVESEGYDTTAPPTVEVFIASYYDPGTVAWSPWPADDLQDPAEWDRMSEVCPQAPPLELLYGGAASPDGD